MIAEALNWIMDRTCPEIVRAADGTEFVDKKLYRLNPDPTPDLITFRTLSGLVDYAKMELADPEGNIKDPLFFHIVSPDQVFLRGRIRPDQSSRTFAVANYEKMRNYFNSFVTPEKFIIWLNTGFKEANELHDEKEALLEFVSKLTFESTKTIDDNGVSQSTVVRRGARASKETPNTRVSLAPFRTFLEAQQPESIFLFRMRAGEDDLPEVGLFDTNGDDWKLCAMAYIASWINEQDVGIPILA